MSRKLIKPATISLIGMPGAGKSTIGVLLAKMSGLAFWDTDLEIQVKAGATLQEILDDEGYLKLRVREEQVLMSVPLNNAVISTGGSAVYSEPVMQRLRDSGPVIYLEVNTDELQRRIAQTPERGIASQSTHKFSDIYEERAPLYRRYAHYTIACCEDSADDIATRILSIVSQESPGT